MARVRDYAVRCPGLAGAVVAALALVSCAGEEPASESAIVVGLDMHSAAQASLDDHLAELMVYEGHVYAANSNQGLSVFRLTGDGGLEVSDVGQVEADNVRCTALAIHAASKTLYCAADAPKVEPEILLYDLSTPGTSTRIGALPLEYPLEGMRDVVVDGDRLILTAFEEGLWTAPIAADGSLGEPTFTGVEGQARYAIPLGEPPNSVVLALFSTGAAGGKGSELRVLDAQSWESLGSLELDGPPLGFSVDAGASDASSARVAVAQGSAGMAIVEWRAGEDPVAVDRITPPAVVSHALLDGERAFAITLSGAFGYVREGEGWRNFGFAPESIAGPDRRGNMLHALLHEGTLITSDWTWVERWAIDAGGEATGLDMPRGVFVPPGEGARWRVRNPSAVDLRADFVLRGEPVFSGVVPAQGSAVVELDASGLAGLLADDYRLHFGVRVHDPAVAFEGAPLSTTSFTILVAYPELGPQPPPGASFPPVTLADLDDAVYTLPLAGVAQRLVWYSEDCVLMWPELEDLTWRHRQGLLDSVPVFVSNADVSLSYARSWDAEDMLFGNFGPAAPPEVGAANEPLYGDNLYPDFVVGEIPGDGLTTDYEVDALGRVVSIERMYRGPYDLIVE
ncbi:hypothetical protein PPSIR1_00782 [Plesiocystis pacifica SIR-1]|uniref:Lipoprotein n=1 Tax=Plesiocystis pacifica SIR-1 TaxID=391625 RepID=A6GJR8_9BACT|nr:hypothetical protein [Plesiocystis pacifica]EDM73895.1 hypothetical protein PPSIR1_00782 [Plesiocystis pacifica SIR-1]